MVRDPPSAWRAPTLPHAFTGDRHASMRSQVRAPAYLHLENIDSCKRDVSAILRADPDHAEAKALHRKVTPPARDRPHARACGLRRDIP